MFGLPWVDILVVAGYFGIVLVIGAWASRRVRGEEDFFLAGRRFGKLIQTFAAFGQGTSADNAVGVSTTTFSNGASGIWSSMLYLFATPVFWFTSAWMRRLRMLTMGDFFAERYGSKRMAAVYALIGTVGMMAFIALGFNAMAKTVVAITPKAAAEFTAADGRDYQAACDREIGAGAVAGGLLTLPELREKESLEGTPAARRTNQQQSRLRVLQSRRPATLVSHVDLEALIWIVCIVVLLYASAGGLEAAFLTDLLQGVGIIILSIILIPFAWARINTIHGGERLSDALGTIHARLPDSHFDLFGSPLAIDFTWYYIIALSVMAMLTVAIQPNQLVAAGSARDEYTARCGFVTGIYMKRTCTVLWGVFGLAAIVLYSASGVPSDLVWGHATRDLLGPLGIGLVGLMIACLMGALMSTADCLMLTASSLLTNNLYRVVVTGRSPAHYVWIGRLFGAGILLGSAWIALQFDTILQILKFIWEMNVALVPAFWLGMKWRKANRLGAWVSILFGLVAFLILPLLVPTLMPGLRSDPALLKLTNPAPLVREYVATEADVRVRKVEIDQWNRSAAEGGIAGPAPEPLSVGQSFSRSYDLPRKGIFWTQGVKPDAAGQPVGKGSLSLELVLVERLGWDLASNPYALNETIRILLRTLTPIALMLVVCLLTRKDDEAILGRFYARMRTRVLSNPVHERAEFAASLADPQRYRHVLLLPRSNWEFYKWNRQDAVGFLVSVAAIFAILGFMHFVLSWGR